MHRLWPGTYAVGRPEVGRLGLLKAATLACGPDARLSHRSAAELWRMTAKVEGAVDVSVPRGFRSLIGIRAHRRSDHGVTRFVKGIPVADPVSVLIDLAAELGTEEVEDAVNEADRLDLIRTHRLRPALEREPRRPGVGRLKRISTRRPSAAPRTRSSAASSRSSARPAFPRREQTVDLGRDQAHARAGLRSLRFTHSQVFHRPDRVREVLVDAFRHLAEPGT